jgi:uncharacterized membrane protein YfcA
MLAEVVRPFAHVAVVPLSPLAHAGLGIAMGIGIGSVSSILGVAGGELLIPTLMFVFGADIKTAGSASILISLGVVLSGTWRYWRLGAIPRGRGARRIAGAMGARSILGAVIGGLAVGVAPIVFLKSLLGCVLLVAAAKTINHHP